MIYDLLYEKYGSQEAIGKALGVTQNAVKRWKAGGGARRETVEKISEDLDLPIGEVYEKWRDGKEAETQ